MASQAQIQEEIDKEIKDSGPKGIDTVRRRKLHKLFSITGRPVLLYAVEMFDRRKINLANGEIIIDLNDKNGFIEIMRNIQGKDVDVVIHSPGGSPDATESIVQLLRNKFNSIRFIIPSVAKSAATMLSMSGNEIILGYGAELGPTDTQMIINGRVNPAYAILKQFDKAKYEISKNSNILPAWLPILQYYGPSLLTECDDALKLSKKLVTDWLTDYMFAGQKRAGQKAATVSRFLASKNHLSHGRPVNIEELRRKGVNIKYASELKPDLSESIEDINQVILATFQSTMAYKIYENHLGKGLYKVIQTIQITNPLQGPQQRPLS